MSSPLPQLSSVAPTEQSHMASKSNALFSKARSSGFSGSTSPLLSILSPPMSPYTRLASASPSSPGSFDSDTPATSPLIPNSSIKRHATPSFDHVNPFKRVKYTASSISKPSQPHYKLPTPTPPPASESSAHSNSSQSPSNELKTEAYLRKLLEPEREISTHQFGSYRLEAFNPAASLVSCCWSSLKQNPSGYLRRERSLLSAYRRHGPSSSNYTVTSHSLIRKTRPLVRPSPIKRRNRPANYSTYYSSESESMSTRSRKATRLPVGGSEQALAVTAFANSIASNASRQSSTPKATSRASTPKPPRAPKARAGGSNSASSSRVHDISPSQLEDYSPPVGSLPVGKSLRAEWKGAPMDLSQDPNLHLLHPAEIHLAAVLRLPADIYLDSKKRLFAEKVHRLSQGLPFRRTDSQKACRIDVNKASRLFSAYEKVGWLEDDLFTKYI